MQCYCDAAAPPLNNLLISPAAASTTRPGSTSLCPPLVTARSASLAALAALVTCATLRSSLAASPAAGESRTWATGWPNC